MTTTKKSKAVFFSPRQRFDDIPEYMIEKNVFTGYRMNLSFTQAFLSLFMIHNETFNIWSALFAFVSFVYLTLYNLLYWEGATIELVIMTIYTATCAYAFFGSMAYHWFNPMNDRVHEFLLKLDISSIALLIGSSFFPPVYFVFRCKPNWLLFYLAVETVLCVATSFVFLVPRFSTDHYRHVRVAICSAAAAFGIIPTIHSIMLFGLSNPAFNETLAGIFTLYGLYGLGAFFYATKIPETIFPGKFDLLFSSHHFWHICAFSASFVLYSKSKFLQQQQVCFGVKM